LKIDVVLDATLEKKKVGQILNQKKVEIILESFK